MVYSFFNSILLYIELESISDNIMNDGACNEEGFRNMLKLIIGGAFKKDFDQDIQVYFSDPLRSNANTFLFDLLLQEI